MPESMGVLTQPFAGAAPSADLVWPSGTNRINITVATLGAMGTGNFTIAGLMKRTAGNCGVLGMLVGSTPYAIQIINDAGIWFGANDFSAGFGTVAAGDWQWIALSKATGTNVYRWHYLDYTTNLGGAPTHANGTGTHANPGTVTAIHIGQGDNVGAMELAVACAWKRVLSDAEINSMFTANLADTRALTPDGLWPLNVAAASVVDTSGNGNNASSVTGTITAGSAPPGFTF
jgi:hypothetical protein